MHDLLINKHKIGDGHRCYVIGEAGSNHSGQRKYAKELVQACSDAGADAIKFQLFTAESLYSLYVDNPPNVKGGIYDTMRQYEFNANWFPELKDLCKSTGIDLIVSPFDYTAIDILEENYIPAFKWASGEIVDLDLLSYASQKRKPMIVSTGMSDLGEIAEAMKVIRAAGNNQIALLHCTSVYPTSLEDANLRMIQTLNDAFDVPIGLSDHTLGVNVSLAAVARGANIIEKHITLKKPISSPDHPYSLKPSEFKNLVQGIREVELSLGMREKQMIKSEIEVAKVARRSLVASMEIPENSILTNDMIIIKRPGTGILPKYKPYVLGRRTKRLIRKDSIITIDDLK